MLKSHTLCATVIFEPFFQMPHVKYTQMNKHDIGTNCTHHAKVSIIYTSAQPGLVQMLQINS